MPFWPAPGILRMAMRVNGRGQFVLIGHEVEMSFDGLDLFYGVEPRERQITLDLHPLNKSAVVVVPKVDAEPGLMKEILSDVVTGFMPYCSRQEYCANEQEEDVHRQDRVDNRPGKRIGVPGSDGANQDSHAQYYREYQQEVLLHGQNA